MKWLHIQTVTTLTSAMNIGDKKVQIVAGAPNAALGLKTIVALPGAMMPSGAFIFPGKLRGEDSCGMMCPT